jgi:hypothetical protein
MSSKIAYGAIFAWPILAILGISHGGWGGWLFLPIIIALAVPDIVSYKKWIHSRSAKK